MNFNDVTDRMVAMDLIKSTLKFAYDICKKAGSTLFQCGDISSWRAKIRVVSRIMKYSTMLPVTVSYN